METLAWIAIALGAVSLLRSARALARLRRWVRSGRVRGFVAGETPPMSVLKPVYGDEPHLTENLTATLAQNYPAFETIFLHERADDPALPAVEAARAAVADVETRVLEGAETDAANPKVGAVLRGESDARHDILVVADSDAEVDPLWLRDIAHALEGADATCFVPVYAGATTWFGRLVSLLKNTDGVLTMLLGAGEGLSGATIAIKRPALERVGGWRAVKDAMADDSAMGAALYKSGAKLALARRAQRVGIPTLDFSHVIRRLRTYRSSAPASYLLGLAASFTPLLLLCAAVITGSGIASAMLVTHALIRIGVAIAMDLRYARDGTTIRALPWLPALWILEPAFAVIGLFGSEVTWRGRQFRVKNGSATLVA